MRRWTLRILAGLLALLLLLLGAVAAIGFTETGTRALLRELGPRLPGSLEYRDLRGALFDRLQLDGLEYRQGALHLSAGQLVFAWSPAALLHGRLQLDRFAVDRLDLQLPPAAPEAESAPSTTGPVVLPHSVGLPLAVRIGAIEGHDLTIHPATGEAVKIDDLALALHTEGDRLRLDRFDVQAPQGAVGLHGDLTAAADYPLALDLDWRAQVPGRGELSGRGRIEGTLTGENAALALGQQLGGLLDARLDARVTQPLGRLAWQLKLAITKFDPGPFAAEFAGHPVSGQLDLHGDLQRAQGRVDLTGSAPDAGRVELSGGLDASTERIQLKDTRLRLPETASQLTLNGSVEGLQSKPVLDLALAWQGLRYPLSAKLPPAFASASGTLNIRGPLDDYRLQLDGKLAGQQIPPTGLKLVGQGNLDRLASLTLTLDSLDGQLVLDGSAGWTPQPVWQLQAHGHDLNPGRQWPDWAGALGFRLDSSGRVDNGAIAAKVEIHSLSGKLREQPLSGSGQLQLAGSKLEIPALSLGWGNARLEASGSAGERLALDWKLKAANLATLLPDADGSLDAHGQLQGTREAPVLKADLSADKLRYRANRLEQLRGTVALDLGWKTPARIDLTGSNLMLAGQPVRHLSLTGGGGEHDHHLDLNVDADAGKLALRLEGGLFDDRWRGKLTRLELDQPDAGAWALQAPVALNLTADSAHADRFCLQAKKGEGRVCGNGDWAAAGNSAGRLQIQRLPLALLSPWLPPATRVDGYLNGNARAQLSAQGALDYDADLSLDQTHLSLPDQGFKTALDQAQASLSGNMDQAALKLDLAMNDVRGKISAAATVQDPAGAGRLQGHLNLGVEDLRVLSLLVPAMQVSSGRLQGDLALAGTLAQPRLTGEVDLSQGKVELPAAGVSLDQISLRLRDDPARPDHLLLDGSASSGGGKLALNGDFQPLSGQGGVTVKGERFQAMGTPEVRLFISPDMRIDLADGRISVGGQLTVPEAMIKPPKLDNAVSVSPDAVVVDASGQPEKAPAGPALDLDLRVILGDKVQVDAFGFNGRLTGGLRLREDQRRVTLATGNVGVASGEYELYGQKLNIERGSFIYTGGPVDNPGLDLRVQREIDTVKVGAQVGGTLRKPSFDLYSDPAMPDSSLLSYLILGRAPGGASMSEQEMLAKLALALGRKGGNAVGERLANALNVDEIGVGGGDTMEETSFYIGKYLSPRLYVKYGVGLLSPVTTFLIRYKLSDRLSFESTTGTDTSGADIIYSFEH